MNGWTKSDVIGLLGLVVAVLSLALSTTIPEVRCYLLKRDCPQSDSNISPNPPLVETSPPVLTPLPQQRSIPSTEPDFLISSDTGEDYSSLKSKLEAKKFREANDETVMKMLRVARKEKTGFLTQDDIKRFPCQDLSIINFLWHTYSNAKFSFSIQQQIWADIGGKPDIDKRFAERVGWIRDGNYLAYDDFSFDLRSERGQLPIIISENPVYLVVIWGAISGIGILVSIGLMMQRKRADSVSCLVIGGMLPMMLIVLIKYNLFGFGNVDGYRSVRNGIPTAHVQNILCHF